MKAMRNSISYHILFLICCLGFISLNANSNQQEYHVVVIDTYQMIRKASLNDELQKLYDKVINEKYMFYYCFYSTPYIVKKSEDMEKLFVNISNNNPLKINTEEDYLRVANLINNDDCFAITNNQIELKYSSINFHFFFDAMNYVNTDIYKLFIRRFILFHQMMNVHSMKIKYFLYFDEQRYDRLGEDVKDKIKNPKIKILKY